MIIIDIIYHYKNRKLYLYLIIYKQIISIIDIMELLYLATILFILLSPGMILTIPPRHHNKVLFSNQTSILAVAIHGIVFYVALYFLLKMKK